MYIDSTAEFRLLACLIDHPEHIANLHEDLFTGERKRLFRAFVDCYTEYHIISSEGLERFLNEEAPVELDLARGAAFEPLLDKLHTLAIKRSLESLVSDIELLLTKSYLTADDLEAVLALPQLVYDEMAPNNAINKFVVELQDKLRGDYRFIDTGLSFMNPMMGGEWPRKGLTVVAGKAGGGKTALVCNSMLNMSEQGLSTLFFSMEMEESKIIARMVAILAEINSLRIRQGILSDLELEKIDTALKHIQKYGKWSVIERPRTVLEIRDMVKKHKTERDICAFFVDYLQILDFGARDMNWESLGAVTQELRQIAVDYDVAAIVLSQQNRQGEGLDALMGSSRIGQVADVVITMKLQEGPNEATKMCEFEWVKNRDGALGSKVVIYQPQYLRFIS